MSSLTDSSSTSLALSVSKLANCSLIAVCSAVMAWREASYSSRINSSVLTWGIFLPAISLSAARRAVSAASASIRFLSSAARSWSACVVSSGCPVSKRHCCTSSGKSDISPSGTLILFCAAHLKNDGFNVDCSLPAPS